MAKGRWMARKGGLYAMGLGNHLCKSRIYILINVPLYIMIGTLILGVNSGL